MKNAKRWMAWLGALALAGTAVAAEVTPEQAATAAGNWVARGYALGQIPTARGVAGVDEISDSATGAKLRVVRLAGGGFVVTPSDDRIDPILAFSASGETLETDEANPLWVLLRADIASREAAGGVRSGGPETRSGARTEAQRKWDALLEPVDGNQRAVGLQTVPDMRVASFVKSRWNQEKVNGEYCWNYYTPGPAKAEEEPATARGTNPEEEEPEEEDHYPCGCVATALAQVMRHFEWPLTFVPATGRRCYVDGIPEERSMIGTEYAWSRMPRRPKSVRLTEAQRQEMGKLTYNIGVSRHMNWKRTGGGSSAKTISSGQYTLRGDFGYASAVDLLYQGNGYYAWSLSEFKKAVIPNFDARSPVALSLPGHAVVADGYGYSGGDFWMHVNMGWGGLSDAWYCPPDIENYTAIDGVVCNIFPLKTGNIVSGRVLDANRTPVAGAAVSAVAAGTKAAGVAKAVATATSDGRGVYALVVPGAGRWTVRAEAAGVEASVIAETTETVPLNLANGEGSYYATQCNIGNTYDNDIVLPSPVEAKSTVTLDRQGGTGGTDEVEAAFGAALPDIVPPALEGYAFGGYWSETDGMGSEYYDSDGKSAAGWNQLEDATIFAKWEPREYALRFHIPKNNGAYSWLDTTVTFGELPAVPSSVAVPEREGYVFGGYWSGQDGTGEQYVSEKGRAIRVWDIAADMTLYAKWEGVQCTVTLDAAGGSGGTESVTATYGSVLPPVTPPEKAGVSFAGYFEGEGGTGTQWYAPNGTCTRPWASTEGLTLHAHWVDALPADPGTFAGARPVAGASGTASFSNADSAKESGEPVHSSDGYPGGASVWASWTAPGDGDWTFWLEGTGEDGSSELDTQLAVYTGTALGSLTRVAANDDTPEGGYSSRLSLHAAAGTVYKIAMDTYYGAPGNLTLRWEEGFIHYAKFRVEFDYPVRFLPRSGGRVEVGVDSSGDWRLVECSDLLSPETAEGGNGDAFACTMAANGTGAERTAAATIRSGDSAPATLSIRQHPMDFATTKAEAVERALAEGRRILLVRGREACWNTRTTLFSSVPSEAVRALVETRYVLWYSNCDRQGDGAMYSAGSALPTVAVLDPRAMETAVAATNGYQDPAALRAFLDASAAETANTPVPVPHAWLAEKAPAILAANGGDYEAAAAAEAANGWPVWKCYLAGVDPADKDAAFRVKSISFVDGEAVLEWDPDLNDGNTKKERRYRIQGKTDPDDQWDAATPSSRFFRVWVGMPDE
jgi:hypothetical protein